MCAAKSNRFSGLTSKPAQTQAQPAVFDKLSASTTSRRLTGALIVPLAVLSPNPEQIRKSFDEGSLQELSEDIRERGVLEPLIVRETEPGQYEIIAGERRYRASKMAGLTEVPVVVRQMDKEEARFVTLVENIQREELSPVDEKQFFLELQNRYNYSITQIAGLIHKSRKYVQRRLNDEILELQKDSSSTEGLSENSLSSDGDSLSNISQSGPKAQIVKEVTNVKPKKYSSTLFKKVDQALDVTLLYLKEQPADTKTREKLKQDVASMREKLAQIEQQLLDS